MGNRLTHMSEICMMDIWSAKARTVITECMMLSTSLNSSTLVKIISNKRLSLRLSSS